MTDESVMQRVKSGDIKQLSVLFDRYHLKLYNFFIRMTRNESLSKDLTQSVFERIIRYRKSFRDGLNFRTWMFQIARNLHKDHYRLNKVGIDHSVAVSDLHLPEENLRTEYLDRELQVKHLERAIVHLKLEYREVMLLAWTENLPYKEIGEILDISEANVKVRMHRAIKKLRQIVENTMYYEG